MSQLQRPDNTLGLRHVALFVQDLAASADFYTRLLGMDIEWQPDADNIYLSSHGQDNLALHRWSGSELPSKAQKLDHIGFIIKSMDAVDDWYAFFVQEGVKIAKEPKTHRDGARSFYCFDPSGIVVQMIYHPPIVNNCGG